MPEAGMGIASFVMGILTILNIVLLTIVMFAASASSMRNEDEFSPFNYVMGGWLGGSALLAICGVVIGIGGIRQKNRRHRLALAGLCMNATIPIMVFFVLLMGTVSMAQTDNRPVSRFVDEKAWKSPAALVMQLVTLFWGVALAIRIRRRRQQQRLVAAAALPAMHTPPDLTIPPPPGFRRCAQCAKNVPETSRFCRRCGNEID